MKTQRRRAENFNSPSSDTDKEEDSEYPEKDNSRGVLDSNGAVGKRINDSETSYNLTGRRSRQDIEVI